MSIGAYRENVEAFVTQFIQTRDDPVFRKKVVVMIRKGWSAINRGAVVETEGAPCPMDANLKICWRFCTTALRQKLTRLHCSVGMSSMAFCQWALI
jgi:hypothetical protein